MLFMGLDVGTTGTKACVFDETGKLLSYGFEEYGISCPKPGYAEQDAEAVLAATLRVMKAAAAQTGGEIVAIGLSVQGDAVIALDENDRPIAPVQLGMDYRSTEDSAAFSERFTDKALFQTTGMRPHPLNSICKIRNFSRTLAAEGKQAKHYVTYADFILRRLGSDGYFIDYPMATRTMAVDLKTMDWNDDLIAFAGADRDQLSKPVPSGVSVGNLSPVLANELGISRNALLVTGGHDQTCAALGAGLVHPDMALDSHGTAEVISTAFSKPRLDDEMFDNAFPCYAHTVPDMFFTFSLNHTGGLLLKWMVENFCEADFARAAEKGESIYSYVLELAGDTPSSLIVLPYFSGKGTVGSGLSAKGMIAGLRMSNTRYDIARATLEALCYDMRENIEALRAAGVPIDSLRCVGGGARSPVGLQLKADVTGLPVHTLAIREAACLGAAMLAGRAVNAFDSLEQAAQIVQLDKTYLPRSDRTTHYDEYYRMYRSLYANTSDILSHMQ